MLNFQKRIWKPQKWNAGFSSFPELNIWGNECRKIYMNLFHTVTTLTTKVCFKNSTVNILQKYIITWLATMNCSSSHFALTPGWNMVQNVNRARKTPTKKIRQSSNWLLLIQNPLLRDGLFHYFYWNDLFLPSSWCPDISYSDYKSKLEIAYYNEGCQHPGHKF